MNPCGGKVIKCRERKEKKALGEKPLSRGGESRQGKGGSRL